MVWGIFKKISEGLKKVFNFVKDKVIAPVAKPIAGVVKTFVPGVAPVIDIAEDTITKLKNKSNSNDSVGYNGHCIRINSQVNNPKIKLRQTNHSVNSDVY